MRSKLVVVFAAIGIAGVSFVIGRWCGSMSASEKLMKEEISHWDQFAAMDSAVLQTFAGHTSTMTSGTYLMQVWFPKLNLGTQEVVLQCENGQITVPAPNTFRRSGAAETLSVTGNVVAWTQEGAGYEANPKYVGIVDMKPRTILLLWLAIFSAFGGYGFLGPGPLLPKQLGSI